MKKLLCTSALVATFLATPAIAGGEPIDVGGNSLAEQVRALQAQVKALQSQMNNSGDNNGSSSAVNLKLTPGFKATSSDGRFSFQPLGRIHLDYTFFDDDKVDHPDSAEFRRARLGFKGTVDTDWAYKVEIDFAGEAVNFKEVSLAYNAYPVKIKTGHIKPFFGLGQTISSNDTTFIERSSVTQALTQSQIIGAAVYGNGDNWSLGLGVWNDDDGVDSTDDEAWQVTGRATYAPIMNDVHTLHLGLAASYRSPDSATDSARLRSRAEDHDSALQAVDTGAISNVENITFYGLELAGNCKSFSAQAEYIATDVSRQGFADADFSGWYAKASYFLTGESRPYSAKSGKFTRVKPNSPFSAKGGTGAWEVAARYSNLDLTDTGAGIIGGEMNNWTFGVNWYINNNIRMMANYVSVDTDANSVTPDDDPNIFLVRAQVDF